MIVSSIADPAFTLDHAQSLAALAGDLNISRRNFTSYPSGHPLVESSIQKLRESFKGVCQGGISVQLGITRDGFLLGTDYIEKGNQICRNVASFFFDRGIASLLILQPPSQDELLSLLKVLVLKREDVFGGGGIEAIWKNTGINSLQINAVRYDRFSGTEELHLTTESKESRKLSLWEQVVKLLVTSELGISSIDNFGNFKPEVLAARINADFSQRLGEGSGLSNSTLQSLTTLVGGLLSESAEDSSSQDANGSGGENADSIRPERGELAAFIRALDPVLRRQILNGFCETVPEDQSRELSRFLGKELMQQTYATAEEYAGAPRVLQNILKKLLPNMATVYQIGSSDDEAAQKLRTLLQEHHLETFMPDGYLQGLLESLKPGTIKPLEPKETTLLLQTLSPQFIDSRGSELLLQLVIADPTGAGARDLIRNLAELCGHFLETGDYGQVLKVLHQAADPRLPQQLRVALRDAFCRREFLDEILSGLKIWGKPKYDQVSQLILVLGRAFIEPLLDHMANEDNMSLRRFMIDRIQSFGAEARPALLARLTDHRWYVLRNIINVLKPVIQKEDVESIRPLLRHTNEKVRHEALRLLMQLGDQSAQRQVLRYLDSDDREIQLQAISLIDRSAPPEISNKLMFLINSGGFTTLDCEVKAAAVHVLGDIGRVDFLPELAKVLGTRSLLAYKALNKLKVEIVRSIEKYPATAAIPLLERLSQGSDDVAGQAVISLKKVRSKL